MSLNKWIIDCSSLNNQLLSIRSARNPDLAAWNLKIRDQFKYQYLENENSEGFGEKEL